MATTLRDLAFTETTPGPKELGWEVPGGKWPLGFPWVEVIYKNIQILVDGKNIIYAPSISDIISQMSGYKACNHVWLLCDKFLQYPKEIVIVGIDEPLEKRSYHYMSGIMKLIYDPSVKKVIIKLACCNLKPWKFKWRESTEAEWKEVDIPPLMPEDKAKEIIEAWSNDPTVQALQPYWPIGTLPRAPMASNNWVVKLFDNIDIVEKAEGKEESIKNNFRVYVFEKRGKWESVAIGFDDIKRSHTYSEVFLWAFYNVDEKKAHVIVNFANDYECKFKIAEAETDWVPPFKEGELVPGKTYVVVSIE